MGLTRASVPEIRAEHVEVNDKKMPGVVRVLGGVVWGGWGRKGGLGATVAVTVVNGQCVVM